MNYKISLLTDPVKNEQIINSEELVSGLIASLVKKESDTLEYFVRNNAIPPIKGKLTIGKLKWRGIQLHQTNCGFGKPIERQLFQRGKPISPLIIITFPIF